MPVILRTLVADGRLAAGVVSASTIQRLYREANVPRGHSADGHTRLRWQADQAGALSHDDVCHCPSLRIGDTTRPLRIHALLDDASRFVVALEAHHSEREDDMLGIFLGVLRRHGTRRVAWQAAAVGSSIALGPNLSASLRPPALALRSATRAPYTQICGRARGRRFSAWGWRSARACRPAVQALLVTGPGPRTVAATL